MDEKGDDEQPRGEDAGRSRRASALESFLKFLTEALALGTRGAGREQKARVVGGIVYVGLAALALVTVAVHASPLAIAGAWGVLVLAALLGVIFHVVGPLHPAVSNALVAAIVLALIGGLGFLGAELFSQSKPRTTELRLRGTVVDNEDAPIAVSRNRRPRSNCRPMALRS